MVLHRILCRLLNVIGNTSNSVYIGWKCSGIVFLMEITDGSIWKNSDIYCYPSSITHNFFIKIHTSERKIKDHVSIIRIGRTPPIVV